MDGKTLSPTRKRSKKRHLTVEEKSVIMNIYIKKHPKSLWKNRELLLNSLLRLKVSTSHQYIMFYVNIVKMMVNLEHQKHTIEENKVPDKVTDEHKNMIRRIAHSFFLDNELPTIRKIMQKISENPRIPNLTKTTLGKVLKFINFRFEKRCRNSVLKEKNEIISWGRRYLRCVKQYKQENRNIFYLDETWVNAGHTVDKVWTDMSIISARQAYVEGLSTGLKHPSGKGKRLIVLHIGSKDGFVENGLLLFESKKKGDYHEDMNSDLFEQWLQRFLPTLPENAVIVLDNASYHSRKYEELPTSATRKADIQTWLRQKIFHALMIYMVKAELLTLVKNHPIEQKYVVDEMIKLTGRCVLRLPPYHCELNPIELIWAQVKDEVARKNSTFKLCDVKILFNQALNNVTANNWQNAVKHVDGIISQMWQLDFIVEQHLEPIIINSGNDDSSSEDSDSNSITAPVQVQSNL